MLGEAIAAYKAGNYADARDLALQAAEELEKEGGIAFAQFIAANASIFQCVEDSQQEDCEEAIDLYNQVLLATSRYSPAECAERGGEVMVKEDGGELFGYPYDCASLKQSASRYLKLAEQFRDRLATESGPLDKLEKPELAYGPSNIMLSPYTTFMDKVIDTRKFTPPLPGTDYLPILVFDQYDSLNHHWISQTKSLRPYHENVDRNHWYRGPTEDSVNGFYPLPIPEGFALDADSVRFNGREDGFTLSQDENGIIYLKPTGFSWTMFPQVEFAIGKRWREKFLTRGVERAREDLLPAMALPAELKKLEARAKIFGTREKVAEVNAYMEQQMRYPEWSDWASGEADYLSGDGLEFYREVMERKVADCDVANSFAVIVLRKLGVPARLVVGWLLQNGEFGSHGWLEYFDPALGHWVRDDFTPSSRSTVAQKEKVETKEDQEIKKTPAPVLTPLKLVTKEEYSPSTTPSQLVDLGFPVDPIETFRFFQGAGFQLSEPDGRYLLAKSADPNTQVVYDLEMSQFLEIPLPPDHPLNASPDQYVQCQLWGGFEAGGGLQLMDRCEKKEPTAHDDFDFWLYDGKKVLYHQTEYLLDKDIALPVPPYYRNIVKQGSNGNLTIAGSHVASDGTVTLVVRHGRRSEQFSLVTIPSEKPETDIVLTEADLGKAFFAYGPENDYGSGAKSWSDFSPDGSCFFLVTDEYYPQESATIAVFKEGQLYYRMQIPEPYNRVKDVELHDDGSLEGTAYIIKLDGELTDQSYQRFAIDSNGNPDQDLLREQWMVWDSESEGFGVGRFRDGKLVKQWEPYNHSFNISSGSLTLHNSGIESPNNFRVLMDQQGQATVLDTKINPCTTDDKPLCLYLNFSTLGKSLPMDTIAIIDPMVSGGTVHAVQLDMHPQYFGEIKLVERKGKGLWKDDMVQDGFAVVMTREPVPVVLLKQLLQKEETPPLEALQTDLGAIAADPKIYLHRDWLLLGLARLGDALGAEAGETRPTKISLTPTPSEDFLSQYGLALAERLKPEVYASVYFPNEEVVVKGWSIGLAGSLANGREDLLLDMIRADGAKAAEALVQGVESKLFAPEDIPGSAVVDSASFTLQLRKALTRRHDLAASECEGLMVLPYATLPLIRYQALADSLANRFGSAILPSIEEKGW